MSDIQAAGHVARDPAASMAGFFHDAAAASSTPVHDYIAALADENENPIHIRTAVDPHHRRRASSLIQRRYAWRGYSSSPLQRQEAGRVTFTAGTHEMTVATLTAGLDSDAGLYVGKLYPEEVGALRAEGRKLCEFTRLAVDESVRSHNVLASIIHVAFMYVINLHRCTDVLIEVNPRHVRFYQRMLGFERAAGERLDPAVNAPAVLLRLDLAHCAREISRLGGNRRYADEARSFYPLFFAPDEAARIVRRLRAHH
jgi:hypothetical protein